MTDENHPRRLREDLLAIFAAGVEAVRSDRLVEEALRREGRFLWIADAEPVDLADVGRIVVVGTGKAGAGMARGVERVFEDAPQFAAKIAGWINVPEDCVEKLPHIHLHGARPAGVNEPTEAGVRGAAEILRLVQSVGPMDVCLCLISGGGSALMPFPLEGITLQDKQEVTRFLAAAGANIEELNTVRKHLSRVKGGGLAGACRQGRLFTLIISDVLGDPLDVIASGPTVPDTTAAADALAVLKKYDAAGAGISPGVFEVLSGGSRSRRSDFLVPVHNRIIGNNAVAVDAAGIEAERRGYSHAMISATGCEGPAEEVGRHLARMALSMRDGGGPDCLISGGEPTVRLADAAVRGKGGRNQQLALAALEFLAEDGARDIGFLSGGTDGEDGPTDAAGAFFDEAVLQASHAIGLCAKDFLARNDAYYFFEPLGALVKTGPTHTNVCDLRIVAVRR